MHVIYIWKFLIIWDIQSKIWLEVAYKQNINYGFWLEHNAWYDIIWQINKRKTSFTTFLWILQKKIVFLVIFYFLKILMWWNQIILK